MSEHTFLSKSPLMSFDWNALPSSRREALWTGDMGYFTGFPCKNGHIVPRYINRKCLECDVLHQRKWALENHNKKLERSRRWVADNRLEHLARRRLLNSENREKVLQQKRDWYAANKVRLRNKLREQSRIWDQLNPLGRTAIAHRMRSKRKMIVGTHSKLDLLRIFALQEHKCAYCTTDIRRKHHVDHIMPLALGGSNFPNNLQMLCPTCNVRKNARHPLIFARELGRLL